ncbi:MAG: acylneuraminate cytidylyltransferase family protein [Pseudomonadota bacterium]
MITYALVPARSGSKGLPDKNIRPIDGHPLLAYSIAFGRALDIDRVIVSTDSEEYAEIARSYGATCPYLRGPKASSDTAMEEDILEDLKANLPKHGIEMPDIWVRLKPTNPFRSVSSVRRAIQMLKDDPTVSSVRIVSPEDSRLWTINEEGFFVPLVKWDENRSVMRRSEHPKAYSPFNLDVFRHKNWLKLGPAYMGKRIRPVVEHKITGLDINDLDDFSIVKAMIEARPRPRIVTDYLETHHLKPDFGEEPPPRTSEPRKAAIATLNSLTRAREDVSVKPDPALWDAIEAVLSFSDVPAEAAARYVRHPKVWFVRRDTGPHSISFVLGLDRRHWLRLTLSQQTSEHVVKNKADLTGADGQEAVINRASRIRVDVKRVKETTTLPVAYRFTGERVLDSFVQVVRMAEEMKAAGVKRVRVIEMPGRGIADPFIMLPRVGLAVERVPWKGTIDAHVVAMLAPDIDKDVIAATGQQLLPKLRPGANGLFVSLEVEKARWINQSTAVAAFVNTLIAKRAAPSHIVYSGMTGPWDGADDDFFPELRAAEEAMVAEIAGLLDADIPAKVMFGQTLEEKAQATADCGFFIAPVSSACLVPNVMGVPGVSFASRARLVYSTVPDNPHVARVKPTMVTDRSDVEGLGPRASRKIGIRPAVSYTIDEAAFVAFALAQFKKTRKAIPR